MTIKNKFLLRQATKVERVLYGNKYEECEYLLRTRTILVATPQVRRNSTIEAANSPCQGCRQPLLRLLTAPVCPSDRGCLLPNQPLFASMFKMLLEKRGYAGFQDRCIQPLYHLSNGWSKQIRTAIKRTKISCPTIRRCSNKEADSVAKLYPAPIDNFI